MPLYEHTIGPELLMLLINTLHHIIEVASYNGTMLSMGIYVQENGTG